MIKISKRLVPYAIQVLLAACTILVAYYFLKPYYRTTGLTIGVLNMQRLQTDAEPFKKLHSRALEANEMLKEKYDAYGKELRKELEEFKMLKNKKILKPDELSKRNAEFDEKVAKVEQELKQDREELNIKFQNIGVRIQEKTAQIIRKYRKDNKIDFLLNTDNNYHDISLADESLDHTDKIIQMMNKEIPDIQENK